MLDDLTDFRHDLNGMVRGGPYVLKADVLTALADRDAELAALKAQRMACQHLQRDCSGLPFHSMPGLWTHPGSVIVKCVEFVKRVP